MANKDLNNSLNADYQANLEAFLKERTEHLNEVKQMPVVEIWHCRVQFIYTDGTFKKGVLNEFKTPVENMSICFLNNDPVYVNVLKRDRHNKLFSFTQKVFITDMQILEKLAYMGKPFFNDGAVDENYNGVLYEDKHNILKKIKNNKPKEDNSNNLKLFENE